MTTCSQLLNMSLCLFDRKFTPTVKVPDTKGCLSCAIVRNPYNGYKYLATCQTSGILLMQWYEPLNKFMQLKVPEAIHLCAYAFTALVLLIRQGRPSALSGSLTCTLWLSDLLHSLALGYVTFVTKTVNCSFICFHRVHGLSELCCSYLKSLFRVHYLVLNYLLHQTKNIHMCAWE